MNLLTIKPTQIIIEHATLSSLVYALTNQKKIVYMIKQIAKVFIVSILKANFESIRKQQKNMGYP
jgi:hypothetical protein